MILCEPRLNLTVLRTVIRLLLKVPYFPLNLKLKKKKKCYKFCSLQSRSYGGEGRLLERMVFVEEIEGIRDSDGGGRMAAAEACV